MGKKALVIGANGLVGMNCVEQLLENPQYEEVTVLTRKYFPLEHPKLVKEFLEFDNLHQSWDWIKGDDLFYCLGTTMAKAGKRAIFRKVELDYALNIAKIAHHNKVKQFIIVSAMGASSRSLFYYNRIKGELENELKKIGFQTLFIVRPALLLGKREEFRFMEAISQGFFKVINFCLIGPLRNIKAVKGSDVAKAMIILANQGRKNTHIILNKEIHDIVDNRV